MRCLPQHRGLCSRQHAVHLPVLECPLHALRPNCSRQRGMRCACRPRVCQHSLLAMQASGHAAKTASVHVKHASDLDLESYIKQAKAPGLWSNEGDEVSQRSAERASAVTGHDVLRLAEHDLSDYCTNLYEDSETERCWLAYNYFEERKKAAEEGCTLEVKDGVVGGVDCQRLDKFEDFIREMVKEGRIASMAKTLATLAGAERRKVERAAGGESTSLGSLVSNLDAAAPGDSTPARDALRAVLAEVFNAHDFNKDGRMDVQEFRAAMRSMGDELSARTVSTIFSAMDVHGWLTFNEFVQIVEAEEVRAHSRFAKGLRTLAPKSKWWTEMPHDVDML